ncbi:hypothetical protein, partial [Phocaeicola massiliensis]|uniref:hypothetical protein n=1 Tax=Phocaeicola massiliensis TaxID=204516 RepID=UPI0032F05F5D
AYEVVMPYHLHMPSYFLETFTEYPFEKDERVFLKDPGLLSGNCYHEKPSAFFIITVLCDRFYPCNTFHINPL